MAFGTQGGYDGSTGMGWGASNVIGMTTVSALVALLENGDATSATRKRGRDGQERVAYGKGGLADRIFI